MTDFLIEALGLLLRWLHVVAAIAWIGESFYFVALDRGLKAAKVAAPGLHGESWSVHGGGFYLKQKFLPAPAELPAELHWSKWKSYTTWLSGFALFALLYLLSPGLYLIDANVAALGNAEAVLLALAFPVLGWFLYDLLCRAVGFRDDVLGAMVALLVVAICYAATHLFAGRAAFLLAGATLATIMSANVFFVIIPGQKRMVAALANGTAPVMASRRRREPSSAGAQVPCSARRSGAEGSSCRRNPGWPQSWGCPRAGAPAGMVAWRSMSSSRRAWPARLTVQSAWVAAPRPWRALH